MSNGSGLCKCAQDAVAKVFGWRRQSSNPGITVMDDCDPRDHSQLQMIAQGGRNVIYDRDWSARATARPALVKTAFAQGATAVVSFSTRHAPVAQWIEHRPPEPGAQVRILSGVPSGGVRLFRPRKMRKDAVSGNETRSSLFFTPHFSETSPSPPAAGSTAPAHPRRPAACTRAQSPPAAPRCSGPSPASPPRTVHR